MYRQVEEMSRTRDARVVIANGLLAALANGVEPPAPRRPHHHHHRHPPRTPELHRSPPTGIVPLGWRPVYGWHPLSPSTAPAGRSAGATRRSAPPRTRAREMRAIKIYAAVPYSADLSMPRVGDDPLARRRRGGRMIDRRERPSSIVRPQPESCPFRFGVVSLGPVYGWHPLLLVWAANRWRQRVARLTDRASMDKDERERGSVCAPKLPEFQCRVLGDDPVAEPRGAAGSRSNIIISVRRERSGKIVRP